MSHSTLAHETKRSFKSFVPILAWLPAYKAAWFRGDLIAALTVWALLVPEGMAYAGIAGMPPEAGLYAAPLALIAYAIFSTSRHLNTGPSSTVAILSASVVGVVVASGQDYITATVTLAILTGVVLIVSGLLKLGIFADFLSKPVLSGFIIGLAITIAFGQIDKLLGYNVEADGVIVEIAAMLGNANQLNWPTLIIGLVSLALLFLIPIYAPKVPGAITVLALSILASTLFNFEAMGVHIVGAIPAGLPPFGLPTGVSFPLIISLLPGAIAIALVGFAESVAAARTYATQFRYEVDANQEMIALGMANIGAGLSQGFVVDGSLSKTAASVDAGGRSQMVSLVTAAAVLVTIVALTPLFHNLPEATLGAIVIHAVWHLINFHKIRRYYSIRRIDFYAALVALLGVVFFGILAGLLMAVIVSLLGLLAAAKTPNTAVLGRIADGPSGDIYRSVANFPDAVTVPGLQIFRFDDDIFFANAPNFRDAVRGVVAGAHDTRWVLIDAESINRLDVTGADMLEELYDELAEANIDMRFARVKGTVRQVVERAGLEEKIGADHFYSTIQAGVDAYSALPDGVGDAADHTEAEKDEENAAGD